LSLQGKEFIASGEDGFTDVPEVLCADGGEVYEGVEQHQAFD
jgi:hypothetical protein